MTPSTRRRRVVSVLAALAATVATCAVVDEAAAAPSPEDRVVTSGHARFEVLSPTLIRTEYAGDDHFTDDATFNAIGRDDFAATPYETSTDGGWLTIKTAKVKLSYKIGSGAFDNDNLTLSLTAGAQDVTARPWQAKTVASCEVGVRCEAEDLTTDGLHVDTNHQGYTGKGFAAGFEVVGNSLALRTQVATAGSYDFVARYAQGDTSVASRRLTLTVDGADRVVTLPTTGNWDTWQLVRVPLDLAAGPHEIVLHRTDADDGRLNVDNVAVVNSGDAYPAPSTPKPVDCAYGSTCEAETAAFTGSASLQSDHNGYSGRGFAAGLSRGAGITEHVVDVPAAGSYALQLRYANAQSAPRTVSVTAGDGAAQLVTLPTTSSWDSWRTVSVPVDLAAGANDVTVDCPEGASCGVNLDTVAVTSKDAPLLAPHAPLGGYRRGLDGVNGFTTTTPGLLYQDGWYLLDDTTSALYDPAAGTITQRGDHGGQPYQDGYLFGYGHDYAQGLTDLATLTGPSKLLPRWAYGVWYSEYYDRTEADYKNDILPKFRADGVPLDVLVTDTDFKSPDRWDGWEIDTSKFPDPKEFFDWAQSQGLHNTLNIHPSILSSDPQFAQAQDTAKNKLTKDNAGCFSDIAHGADCYVFDWADPDQLKAYFDLHQTMEQQGADFWWLDWCCEQSKSTIPGVTPDAWINQQYANDTAKQVGRGFAFSRAFGSLQAGGYSGPTGLPTGPWADKRTTVHFTGDTTSSWGTLAMEVGYTPGEAASTGLSAVSHDIGGFNNDGSQPAGAEKGSTKEADDLYARWVQLGTFQPIDRLHGNHSDRLPWQYGPAAKDAAEKALRLREALVPYTYGLAHDTARTGVPVVRPTYLAYPDAQEAYGSAGSEYLYGPDVLVAPVTSPGNTATTSVWFPPGSSWTDWFTGTTYQGGTTHDVATSLDTMPVFVRSGGIVATRSQNVDNDVQNPLDAVTLTVAGGADGSYSLYEDDGDTTTASDSATTAIHYTENGSNHLLTIDPVKGSFPGQVDQRSWTARFTGAGAPTDVRIDGTRIASSEWTWDAQTHVVTVTVPKRSVTAATTVSWKTNHKPVAPSLTVNVHAGRAQAINLPGSDEDGDTLAYSYGTPNQGSVKGTGAKVTYTPERGFLGTDRFTYTVTDPAGTSATGTVTVRVSDRAPAAYPLRAYTRPGRAVALHLHAADPDHDVLTYTHTAPHHGVLRGSGASLVYTPRAGFTGTDAFSYAVKDPTGLAARATVTITVRKATPAVSVVVSPRPVPHGARARVTIRVSASGESVNRDLVTVWTSGRKIASGRLVGHHVVLRLPKLAPGYRTLVVRTAATATVSAATKRVSVRFR